MTTPYSLRNAVSAHARWKVRILNAVDGQVCDVTGPDASCDDRCDLGTWLRGPTVPEPVRASAWLMLAGRFVPWLHFDDHPGELLDAGAVQTSLPNSLEAFALRRWPTARHIGLCHGPQGVVQREGGAPLLPGCLPQPGDRVTPLD